jgi:NAD-dependent deacetylase
MIHLSANILESIRDAAEIIRASHHIVVLTGAGSSTPSGIPDFRSIGSGLWTKFSPLEVASLTAFRHQPEKFFEWLHPLASHMMNAQPNTGHISIAELEKKGIIKTTITQNIDGLHQRAGSKNVLEVHGSMDTLTCIGCYHQFSSDKFIEPYIQQGEIPYCPDCNKILKPDVVLFEEQLPRDTWLKALQATKNCDLMIVVGSSLVIMPVASLPTTALENDAQIIVVNKTETYVDCHSSVVIHEDLAEIIPAIAREVLND